MRQRRGWLLGAGIGALAVASLGGQGATIPGKGHVATQEFLYQLKATRSAMLVEGMTAREASIAAQHSAYLEELSRKGTVVLYGRTQNSDETAFGIVVFRAASQEEARAIVDSDPGVRQGLMKASLYPYKIAFIECTKT